MEQRKQLYKVIEFWYDTESLNTDDYVREEDIELIVDDLEEAINYCNFRIQQEKDRNLFTIYRDKYPSIKMEIVKYKKPSVISTCSEMIEERKRLRAIEDYNFLNEDLVVLSLPQ